MHAIALAAAVIATSGCGGSEDRGSIQQAIAATAEFRYEAGEVYENLTMESCEPNPALRRAVVLGSEGEAIRAFERRLRGTPLEFHLAVARNDATRRIGVNRGCWADSDPDFARIHVQMARDGVRGGVQRLEALASELADSLPEMSARADEAVEFRYQARRFLEGFEAPCPMSSRAENVAILAPARAELQRFRQRLDGTAYAIHFDLAWADAAYIWSITEVSCVEPDTGPPAELRREALEEVRRQIAELEARLPAQPTRDPST